MCLLATFNMKIAVKFCGRCISIYLVRPARWSAGGTQPDNHNIDLIIILKLILPRLRTLLRGQKLLRSVCGHGRPGPASYSEGSISVAPGSGLGAANIEPSVGLVVGRSSVRVRVCCKVVNCARVICNIVPVPRPASVPGSGLVFRLCR